jgi:acetolactate synthase-1/2/3 large subunit
MKLAQSLVKTLEHEGVTHIFALPGEEIEDILFALRDSPIQLVTCRHEQGAAFMADVWGRLTGRAGVCLATLGPGATNLITGLADAHMDKSPVVAITGQADMKRMHKESHQYIDVVGMMKPITKWNLSLHDASILPEVVRKAFKLSQMEKPGVTHIEIPEDLAKQEVTHAPLQVRRVRRGAPDHKAIMDALNLIRDAKKPMILAGNGAVRKLASKHLSQFVESSCIPFTCTFMGKGAVSDRRRCWLRSHHSSRCFTR